MPQIFKKLSFNSSQKNFIDITKYIERELETLDMKNGLLNLSILHTSCSLLIQENADNSVLRDLENFFDNLVPQNLDLYEHKAEGVDDMPAHIKASLTSTHLSIPIRNKKIDLGTWQGIFLFEHRIQSHTREIDIHIIGTH